MKFFRPTPRKGYPTTTSTDSGHYFGWTGRQKALRQTHRVDTFNVKPPEPDPEKLLNIVQKQNKVIQDLLSGAKKQNESLQFILRTLKTLSQAAADQEARIKALESPTTVSDSDGNLIYEWPLPSPKPRRPWPKPNP